MNPTLKAMMAADLVYQFADQGDTATIQTQSNVPVVATSTYENQAIDEIGQMQEFDLSLVVQTVSLSVTPVINGTVTYNNKSYRIRGIERHGDENAITLMLQHPMQ